MRVLKLAQPGFDAKTAGDENLIYNSRWPLLPIYKQGSFASGDVTQAATIVEHNLGYPAMFWFFSNAPASAATNTGDIGQPEKRSEFFGPVGDATIQITNNKLLYVPSSSPTTSGSIRLYYYVFAIDLTKQFTAPIIKVGGVGGAHRKRVFKIAKAGKSVYSDNLDDFIIHSDARSPLVHSVNPGTVKGGKFIVEHNLSYNPMFFAYSQGSSGGYTLLATGSGGSTILQSDTQKVSFSEAISGRVMSIIILKDPFAIDYSVDVDV